MNLRVGMVAPNAYELNLSADGIDVDLTQVASASFKTQRPRGGSTSTWAATLGTPTATTLKLTHIFASGELDVTGTWAIYAVLTLTGGGTLTTPVLQLPVVGEFDIAP